jgi:hypothetical protein
MAGRFPTATRTLLPGTRQHQKMSDVVAWAKQPSLLIDGEAKPFDPAAIGACLAAAPGYWTGFDAAVRTQSIADAVRFLQRNLQP